MAIGEEAGHKLKILIVGGGTAGLVSAIILKKLTSHNIDVVYSSKVGIVGVGEGSTEHFSEFMKIAGISHYEIIRECDATHKFGIMFRDWTDSGKDYLHGVGYQFNKNFENYCHVYAKQISEGDDYLSSKDFWDSNVDEWYVGGPEDVPVTNQYHFNTYKLNDFLTKKARSLGIGVFDDDIQEVRLNSLGEIDTLLGSNKIYDYDFYVDSTGMRRVLMSQLDSKWESFGKYLKMKEAITFPTEDEDNYNIWTLAKAMDAGWMFKLPVWGRYGNGYIYDSDYISKDQAKEEVDKLLGYDVEIGRSFTFDPGYLKEVWSKNCVAVGLSGSFVEPLEATSIGTTIQQSVMLSTKINENYSSEDVLEYNKHFASIMDNIRDFISLHYVTDKKSTDFWRDLNNSPIPESLSNRMQMWKTKLPMPEDFASESPYKLFGNHNYILVLDGIGWFDREAIRMEYEGLPSWIKNDANLSIKMNRIADQRKKITHKQMLDLTRSNF